jgi:hypothetical protein
MNHSSHHLKIVLTLHHFSPNFKAGAEWRTHRTFTWLQCRGHVVKVAYIESIRDTATSDLRWVDEVYDSLSVHSLFLNLSNAPDPASWDYDNPWVEAHLTEYLAEEKPDTFHLSREID